MMNLIITFSNFARSAQNSQLLLYREMIAICFEIHVNQKNPACKQGLEFCNVSRDYTYSMQ